MTREFLERLYWECSDQEKPYADGLNLGEMYERTGEADNASSCFSKKLYTISALTNEEKVLLENLSSSAAMSFEKQGFINGFRLGMKLAGELKGGAEDGC